MLIILNLFKYAYFKLFIATIDLFSLRKLVS